MFWPRDVWGRYAPRLEAFKEPGHRPQAVQCLNHMVRAVEQGVRGGMGPHTARPRRRGAPGPAVGGAAWPAGGARVQAAATRKQRRARCIA